MSDFSSTLMEHFSNPLFRGAMDSPHAVGRASRAGQAPFVTFYLQFDGERIAQIAYETFGCGVSIACCSALSELVAGRTLREAADITTEALIQALDGVPPHKAYCAHLAVEALRDALSRWEGAP